ncbi:lipase class 3 [Nitzschia inconspicua]|uniref:Lipase class 3 n=1 Tax=Nitzschia inconspicua TaxID=303405 RepID=A0A9K3M5Y0_9STRA|nr:lipase class 3 [Nitzschia inconspicua]
MPAIYLFRKRTILGGDDLQVPCLITVLIRCGQALCLILPLSLYLSNQARISNGGNLWEYLWNNHHHNNNNNSNDDDTQQQLQFQCSNAHMYPLLSSIFLLTSILFCILSFVLEYRLWHWSCQGTPTLREPRTSKVQLLLEVKLVMTIVLLLGIGITFVTACTFAKTYHNCYRDEQEQENNNNSINLWVSSQSWYILGATLFLSQLAELIVTCLFVIRLTSCFGLQRGPDPNLPGVIATVSSSRQHELIEEMWADRCNSLFYCLSVSTCFLFGGQDLVQSPRGMRQASGAGGGASMATAGGGQFGIYQHVAQALADYLETRGTLDVVPTDLVTGLLVLQRLQRHRILQARRHIKQAQNSHQNSESSLVENSSLMNHQPNQDDVLLLSNTTPDAQTGLRSRVASTSDLIRQGSRTLSQNSSHGGLAVSGAIEAVTSPIKSIARTTKARSKSPPTVTNLPETTRLVSAMGSSTPRTTAEVNMLTSTTNLPLYAPPPSIHMSLTHPTMSTSTDQYYDQYQQQRAIYRRCHSKNRTHAFYQATSRQVLNPHNPIDIQRLEEGARMAKYALAIYTWMLFVFVHPVTGIPRLCCQSCKLCCLHRRIVTAEVDDEQRIPIPSFQSPRRRRPRRRRSSSRDDDLLDTDEHDRNQSSNGSYHSSSASSYHDDDDAIGGTTVGDTLCQWHKHSLLLVAGLSESDLVYAQFQNRFSMVPYCILLDHERSLVILSIRGSLSLEDVVTDTLVQPEPLDTIGEQYGFDAQGQFCHAGVLACFENIYQDLRRHGLLEQLLLEDYPTYELRIVGHSLGAGVSTLMGYVLRSKFPSLKVYGFSPPGCTMTWKLATDCIPWTTSFILDNDIVPRLSVLALEDLRDEVLELIGRIKVPKYKVFETFLRGRDGRRGCINGSDGASSDFYDDDVDDLTHVIQGILDEVPQDTLYYRQVQEFLQVQQTRKESRGDTSSRRVLFYPPGRMIHLLKTGEEGGCAHLLSKCLTCCTSNSGFVYTPVYISNDDLDEIIVNATMGTDHFIDRMADELHKVAENYTDQPMPPDSGLGDVHGIV